MVFPENCLLPGDCAIYRGELKKHIKKETVESFCQPSSANRGVQCSDSNYERDFPPLGLRHSGDSACTSQERQTPEPAPGAARNAAKRRPKRPRRISGKDIETVLGIHDQVQLAEIEYMSGDAYDYLQNDADECYWVCDAAFDRALEISELLGWEDYLASPYEQRKLPWVTGPNSREKPTSRRRTKVSWSFISRRKLPKCRLICNALRISVESAAVLNTVEWPVRKRDRWLPKTPQSARRFLARLGCSGMDFEDGSALQRCVTRSAPTPPRPASSGSSFVRPGCKRSCRGDCDCTRLKGRRGVPLNRPGPATSDIGYASAPTRQSLQRRVSQPVARAKPRSQWTPKPHTVRSKSQNPAPAKFELRAASGRVVQDLDTALARALEVMQHRDISPEDYELLLQLDASVPNKTAPASVVSTLPTTVWLSGDGERASDQCLVCMDEYCTGQTLAALPCGHAFHRDCIDRWLLNSSPNCPLDGLPLVS